MGLNTNGVDQRWSITGSLFHSSKVYTVAVVVKIDNTTSTSQFIFGGFHNGGLTRFSGAMYRADQSPKYIAKAKSSATIYSPASGSADFTPSGTDWNIFIFSRSVTGAAAGAFAASAVKAAAADEVSRKRLEETIRSSTNATEAQIKSIDQYITKQSIATATTDDQLRPALSRLIRSTNDVTKAQELLNLSQEIAAAT